MRDVRASVQVYSGPKDIDALVSAISEARIAPK